MEFPVLFQRLVASGRYDVVIETDPIWGPTRPWRMTCRACGKVFHPLVTMGAVANIEQHTIIKRGQPARCHVVLA